MPAACSGSHNRSPSVFLSAPPHWVSVGAVPVDVGIGASYSATPDELTS